MVRVKSRINRSGLVLLAGLTALLLAGCQEEPIRRYKVPRTDSAEAVNEPGEAKVRLLAAIFPHGERTWFFKLAGPIAQVNELERAFDAFIGSVRLADKGETPVSWTLPEGWKEQKGSGLRYATIQVGKADPPLELTVFAFGKEAGSMRDNVDRWRKLDLGLPPIRPAELAKVTKETPVNGVTVTRVDMTGPGAPKGGKGRM